MSESVSGALPVDAPAFPVPSITGSRRLMGPNRFDVRPGVVLEVDLPDDAAARLDGWRAQALALAGAMGWDEPSLRVMRQGDGASLFMAVPVDVLLVATDVNEHAWAAAETGTPPSPGLVATLRAAAAAEQARHSHLAPVYAEARARGVSATFDDDELTLGAGHGSRTWPLAAIPAEIPWGELAEVPIALVTGSNGKTTVTRLLSAMWREAGRVPGFCCTDGVWVGSDALTAGDYSGPAGARAVLRDRRVQAAVLETARGGMMRRGLAPSRADAAVITNISADHFGEYGVESLAGLADAKAVVERALDGGTLVLNADDATLVDLSRRVSAPIAWFSASGGSRLVDGGGPAAAVRDGHLRLFRDGWIDLGAVADMPLTLGGAAPHNVENLAAAALLALVGGVPLEAIRATVARFGSEPGDNPGRLQVQRIAGVTVLVDYAHNPDGIAALCETARTLPAARRGIVLGQAGDRDDFHIRELVRTAWSVGPFDRVFIKEMESLLRGRERGVVPALIADELSLLGVPAENVERFGSELEALRGALDWALPGDLLVCPTHAQRAEVAAELKRRQ